jgi:hypothetical protein
LTGFANATNSTSPSFAAELGVGIASGVHASSSSVWSGPSGNGSARSLNVNTWAIGDYFEFSTSTTGYTNIGVSWSQTSSGTGPIGFALTYSTDGFSFTTNNTYLALNNASTNGGTWNSGTFVPNYVITQDLSSVLDLNNAASVTFRLVNISTVSGNGGTVAATGTARVDDFTVFSVDPVPEPSQIAMFGLGALGLVVYRLRAARRR